MQVGIDAHLLHEAMNLDSMGIGAGDGRRGRGGSGGATPQADGHAVPNGGGRVTIEGGGGGSCKLYVSTEGSARGLDLAAVLGADRRPCVHSLPPPGPLSAAGSRRSQVDCVLLYSLPACSRPLGLNPGQLGLTAVRSIDVRLCCGQPPTRTSTSPAAPAGGAPRALS